MLCRKFVDAGFNDFLAKPVMEEELFGILKKHLELRWISKEYKEFEEYKEFK